ncbi:transcriptional regulator, TetR family [Sanguibacter gelidistatuariae]|uniref:Transcriptional regulator, TetR family n=1 Tax=Sanguibacter gelidistatuariae TaxID=1814289 RepID=A0A1G6RRL0_9MICO|nr:TetR/AcrR family transcriptional regulator [Sanguibacter gelidistatuariae]SDD07033.1 transcriptional regulator, TetR family [Sanguibacter gelidistatuariae]
MSQPPPTTRTAGRPRASSREILEEAAGELFLERGYAATSVADITARAGVSRNTFFNYFAAKSDLLWSAFDAGVAGLEALLHESMADDAVGAKVRAALRSVASALPPGNVALAFINAEPMGLTDELRRAAALRGSDVGVVVARFAVANGVEPLHAEVAGAAYAGALVAAVGAWSRAGATRTSLLDVLDAALVPIYDALP